MDPAQRQALRQTMLDFEAGDEWLEVIEEGSPGWLFDFQQNLIDVYRAGDVDGLLELTHPDAEISQPAEIPGARSYRGHEGMAEAVLDWPRQWDDFRVEPKRIYSPDEGRFLVQAVHRGRSRQMDLEVEAEVTWLFSLEDARIRRWEMFMGKRDL